MIVRFVIAISAPFTGLPVILEEKDQIIEFVHPACCAYEDRNVIRCFRRTREDR